MKNKTYIFLFLVIVLNSCSNPWKKQEELEIKLADRATELANLRIQKNEIENQFQQLSDKSVIEKDSLMRQMALLNNRIEELQNELTELRQNSIDPSDQSYTNTLTTKIEELEQSLVREQEQKANLENTIVKLQIDYKNKSQAYVQRATQTLITVYENLMSINELKSSITEDLSKYRGGARPLNLSESIKSNLQQVQQKINDTKNFLNRGYAVEDSLQELTRLNNTLLEKVSTYEKTVTSMQGQIQDLITQIEELNKGFYLIKSQSELKDLGIIKGRFLGFGNIIYQAEHLREEFCKIADKTATYITIPHSSDEEVVIYSPHSINSYRIINESATVTRLDIRNAKEFWRKSNYLVIGLK